MRILLVSTTAIGDTVMATPFLRAVRKRHPHAHITFFAHHRRMEILRHNPHLDVLMPYYGKGRRLVRTLWALRRAKFNMAIVLHANDPDIVPLVRWTRAPFRVGWKESKWSALFTHTIRRRNPPEHFLVHKKRLLESVGIPVEDLHTEIFLQDGDGERYRREIVPWLQRASPAGEYVAMHAFGTNPGKWWPLDRFFSMAEHIRKEKGWPAVFVGDAAGLRTVERHPKFDPAFHLAAAGFGIRESACVIRGATRMLTTDSGPMHLAFAVKCPTLCLFGPTKPEMHGPIFDTDRHHVIHHEPLSSLTLETVRGEWDRWVSSAAGARPR